MPTKKATKQPKAKKATRKGKIEKGAVMMREAEEKGEGEGAVMNVPEDDRTRCVQQLTSLYASEQTEIQGSAITSQKLQEIIELCPTIYDNALQKRTLKGKGLTCEEVIKNEETKLVLNSKLLRELNDNFILFAHIQQRLFELRKLDRLTHPPLHDIFYGMLLDVRMYQIKNAMTLRKSQEGIEKFVEHIYFLQQQWIRTLPESDIKLNMTNPKHKFFDFENKERVDELTPLFEDFFKSLPEVAVTNIAKIHDDASGFAHFAEPLVEQKGVRAYMTPGAAEMEEEIALKRAAKEEEDDAIYAEWSRQIGEVLDKKDPRMLPTVAELVEWGTKLGTQAVDAYVKIVHFIRYYEKDIKTALFLGLIAYYVYASNVPNVQTVFNTLFQNDETKRLATEVIQQLQTQQLPLVPVRDPAVIKIDMKNAFQDPRVIALIMGWNRDLFFQAPMTEIATNVLHLYDRLTAPIEGALCRRALTKIEADSRAQKCHNDPSRMLVLSLSWALRFGILKPNEKLDNNSKVIFLLTQHLVKIMDEKIFAILLENLTKVWNKQPRGSIDDIVAKTIEETQGQLVPYGRSLQLSAVDVPSKAGGGSFLPMPQRQQPQHNFSQLQALQGQPGQQRQSLPLKAYVPRQFNFDGRPKHNFYPPPDSKQLPIVVPENPFDENKFWVVPDDPFRAMKSSAVTSTDYVPQIALSDVVDNRKATLSDVVDNRKATLSADVDNRKATLSADVDNRAETQKQLYKKLKIGHRKYNLKLYNNYASLADITKEMMPKPAHEYLQRAHTRLTTSGLITQEHNIDTLLNIHLPNSRLDPEEQAALTFVRAFITRVASSSTPEMTERDITQYFTSLLYLNAHNVIKETSFITLVRLVRDDEAYDRSDFVTADEWYRPPSFFNFFGSRGGRRRYTRRRRVKKRTNIKRIKSLKKKR